MALVGLLYWTERATSSRRSSSRHAEGSLGRPPVAAQVRRRFAPRRVTMRTFAFAVVHWSESRPEVGDVCFDPFALPGVRGDECALLTGRFGASGLG
jgi:hypothetical protein